MLLLFLKYRGQILVANLIDLVSLPCSKEDPKAAASQLTIFYSGKVLVFDDYPSNKLQDLIAFADKESSRLSCATLPNFVADKSSSREGLPTTYKEKTSISTTTTTTEANGSGNSACLLGFCLVVFLLFVRLLMELNSLLCCRSSNCTKIVPSSVS